MIEKIVPAESQPAPVTAPEYVGFWQRACAAIADGILLNIAVLWPFSCLYSYSKAHYLVNVVAVSLVSVGYDLFFHARFGQTLGKMAMKIQVRRLDLAVIGWKEAILRSSLDIAFRVVGIVGTAIAVSKMDLGLIQAGHLPLHKYFSAQGDAQKEFVTAMQELDPLHGATMIFAALWLVSEFVVIFLNPKRRAVHDYVAGTVVIKQPR